MLKKIIVYHSCIFCPKTAQPISAYKKEYKSFFNSLTLLGWANYKRDAKQIYSISFAQDTTVCFVFASFCKRG